MKNYNREDSALETYPDKCPSPTDLLAILFSSKPDRRQLLDLTLPSSLGKTIQINVWRNHNFETLIPLLEPYFWFGGWRPIFRISPYDDTLRFDSWQPAAVELLWLDRSRFRTLTPEQWLDWLSERLAVLRTQSSAPIVLATWTTEAADCEHLKSRLTDFPAVHFADLEQLCKEAELPLLDQRMTQLSGTPIANAAQVLLARKLACHWLPAVFSPPIKALALDLDNTLHAGILGEDGVTGVTLTPEHRALQEEILALRRRGVFITLVSRNEAQDVEDLFAERSDYPLRQSDFSLIEASWDNKANALQRISDALRIAPDALLFVDDNPGEVSDVAMQLPQTRTLLAAADAALTRCALQYYPALWRWRTENDDLKRIDDLQANIQRATIAQRTNSPSDYFRSLKISLTVHHNEKSELGRLADLCTKTNQFNLALRRFTLPELAERMASGQACVSSVQLRDRLTDSGIIAVIVGERDGVLLRVTELCISCRALGRKLEDTIIMAALRGMPIFSKCRNIEFCVELGPRNTPARAWLATRLGQADAAQTGNYALSKRQVVDFAVDTAIKFDTIE